MKLRAAMSSAVELPGDTMAKAMADEVFGGTEVTDPVT